MLLLLLKSIPALLPFLSEIVNGSQRKVGERRPKNKLAPWLILSLFINLVYMVYGFNWVATNNDHVRKLTLENDRLEQQMGGISDLRAELSDNKKKVRAQAETIDGLEDQLEDTTKTLGEVTTKYATQKTDLETQTMKVLSLEAQYNALLGRYELERKKHSQPAPVHVQKKQLSKKSSDALRHLMGEEQ